MGNLAQSLPGKRRGLFPVSRRVVEGPRIDKGDHPSARLLGSTAHFNIYADPVLEQAGVTVGDVSHIAVDVRPHASLLLCTDGL